MLVEPPLRITLVFVLTLVFPSVLLSAFAFQAVEAERRARLAERSARVQDEARELAHGLDAIYRAPARRMREVVRRLKLTDPLDATEPLSRLVASEPLLAGLFVLDADGHRIYPAARPLPKPEPWSASESGQLGGLLGSILHPPELLLQRAEALADQDPSAAGVLLERVARTGGPRARITALYDLGQLHEGSELVSGDRVQGVVGLLNATVAYEALAKYPIHLTDLRGRPAAALGRFRLALVHLALNQSVYQTELTRLLRELEEAAPLLSANDVAQLGERAARLLKSEEALSKARALSDTRRQLEARYAGLENLFGEVLQAALRQGRDLPRIRAGDLEGEGSSTGLSFVKRRVAKDYELLTYALLPGDDGGRSRGLVAFHWNMRALRAAFADRIQESPLWLGTLTPWTGPDVNFAPGVARARLLSPFSHLAIEVSARPEPAVAQAVGLTVPRETLQLWAIALSMVGILMGVGLTTRTIRRESKAAQLKSDFVSNVTHELKTPLTSIRMFLETLQLDRVADDEERRECLSIMDRETQRLTRLIEQLLVFSRIENKKWRARVASVSPRALVDEAIHILANQLHMDFDDLEIEVVAVQDLPPVPVDQFAAVEALLNLLHNAWKYSPNEDRKIRVVITSRRANLEIAVEDNGMGVPRSDRRRIFVKFERASNAEQSRIEGSGIGLTLATEIAKAHGGTIKYTPLKPRGSRFAMILPK